MSNRTMKRLESRKSHSWWFDSHIIPKSNKWLADNLQEMDRSVNRMLKLIEEEGDSFAKKAEMYYQKRPELIAQVEEFYRMYRSLAERYDNLTGELRKSMPADQLLQTQSSGVSDAGSESGHPPLPAPKEQIKTHSRRKSIQHRAAGFEVFLGSRPGSEKADSDDSSDSSSDSEAESDSVAWSKNIYSESGPLAVNGSDDMGLSQKIVEMEIELREVKEKLRMAEEENSSVDTSSPKDSHETNGNSEDLLGRIQWYEEELSVANEKLRCTQEEIERLTKINIENGLTDASSEAETTQVLELQEKIATLTIELEKSKSSIIVLEEQSRAEEQKLRLSEEEVARLKHELEQTRSSLKEIEMWADELSEEESATLKLELEMTKSLLKEIEVWAPELKERNKVLEMNASNHDTEVAELKLAISDAELKFNEEISQLQQIISDLEKSQGELKMKLKNSESKIVTLVDDFKVLQENREAVMRSEMEILKSEIFERGNKIEELNKTLDALKLSFDTLTVERDGLNANVSSLVGEMEILKSEIAERGNKVEELNKTLDALKLSFDTLTAERDELNANVSSLVGDVGSRDDRIRSMEDHLQRLHIEQVELVSACEEARKESENQTRRIREMEEEVERQRMVIIDAAEEKREAIRQLCFSMEHYRNNYDDLRNAFLGHRKQVLAS